MLCASGLRWSTSLEALLPPPRKYFIIKWRFLEFENLVGKLSIPNTLRSHLIARWVQSSLPCHPWIQERTLLSMLLVVWMCMESHLYLPFWFTFSNSNEMCTFKEFAKMILPCKWFVPVCQNLKKIYIFLAILGPRIYPRDMVNYWFNMEGAGDHRLTCLTADPINLQPSRSRLEIRSNFFSQRVENMWNSLPRELEKSEGCQSEFQTVYKRRCLRLLVIRKNK